MAKSPRCIGDKTQNKLWHPWVEPLRRFRLIFLCECAPWPLTYIPGFIQIRSGLGRYIRNKPLHDPRSKCNNMALRAYNNGRNKLLNVKSDDMQATMDTEEQRMEWDGKKTSTLPHLRRNQRNVQRMQYVIQCQRSSARRLRSQCQHTLHTPANTTELNIIDRLSVYVFDKGAKYSHCTTKPELGKRMSRYNY